MTDEELEALAAQIAENIRRRLPGEAPWDLEDVRKAADAVVGEMIRVRTEMVSTTTQQDIDEGRFSFQLSISHSVVIDMGSATKTALHLIGVENTWPLDGDPWERDTMGDVTECHHCHATKPGHRKGCMWVEYDPCSTCDGTGIHTELGGLLGGICQSCGGGGRR